MLYGVITHLLTIDPNFQRDIQVPSVHDTPVKFDDLKTGGNLTPQTWRPKDS